jgi:hypothetical protein
MRQDPAPGFSGDKTMKHSIRHLRSMCDALASIGAAVRASREFTCAASIHERAGNPSSAIPL